MTNLVRFWIIGPDGEVENASLMPDGATLTLPPGYTLTFNEPQEPAPSARRRIVQRLRAAVEDRISLLAVVDGGSSTSVTGTQFANYMAALTNRYRVLRAQVAAANTRAELEAIDINSGWPNNP